MFCNMKALTVFRICFVLALTLSGINGSVAENLFDVVVDDGTSPTKGYIFLDTITNQDRVVQIDRSGNVTWQAQIPRPAKLKKRCRGADIEYDPDRDMIRVLIPFDSIIEIDRRGSSKILVEDYGLSHDFDSRRNGNILYTRGWSRKGDSEVIEVDKNGKTVFEWIGSNFISEEDWQEHAKIGSWPAVVNINQPFSMAVIPLIARNWPAKRLFRFPLESWTTKLSMKSFLSTLGVF